MPESAFTLPPLDKTVRAELHWLQWHYESLARAECKRRGVDPDEIISDAGHAVWQIIGHEVACLNRKETVVFMFDTDSLWVLPSGASPMQAVRLVAPGIFVGKTLNFSLKGVVPVDGTFVEPTCAVQSATDANGNPVSQTGGVTLSPSVMGSVASDGTTPFTTAGVFAAGSVPCTVVVEADVLGADDSEFSVVVSAIPPESVAFDPNGFVANL